MVSAARTANAALVPLFEMARTAPEQTKPDDAVAYDHDGGEDGIARQPCLFARSCNHDRDDERHLNNRYGHCQDERAEWLAGAMRDHLGVVDCREYGGDQGHCCGGCNRPGGAGEGHGQQNQPCQ